MLTTYTGYIQATISRQADGILPQRGLVCSLTLTSLHMAW